MIFIVHGDDYPRSRKLIVNQQKKLNVETKTELDITEITPNQLTEAVSSFDLFGNAPFIVLNITAAKNKDLEEFSEALKKVPDKSVLIILSEKVLSKNHEFVKLAKEIKAKIVESKKKVGSNVFKFTDSLFSKNRILTYNELNKLTLEEHDPFYIFSMILYGLRNVTHAKYNTENFRGKSGFIKQKTQKQAEKFDPDELLSLFHKLYLIDKDLKTGRLEPEIALIYTVEKVLS